MSGEAMDPAEMGAALLKHSSAAPAEVPFRDLLESAPDAIVIVDQSGRIVLVNTQAERWLGYGRGELIGQAVELLIPAHLRVAHERHRDHYYADPRTRPMGVGRDLAARRKDGSEFPAEISLSPVQTPQGMLIIAIIRDISERKQAEASLRQKTVFVELLQTATVAANTASSIEEAFQFTLRLICTHTGWPVGHAYRYISPPSDMLQSMGIWYSAEDDRFAEMRAASEGQGFRRGEGLPGRVLSTGKPAWMVDVTQDAGFVRRQAAAAGGIRSAYVFPILAGSEVVGALEFFSLEPKIPAAPLLDVMANIGTQLGRVVERRRAADELEGQVARRTAHLNALLHFSKELLLARSLDAVLQRAIGYARMLAPEAQRGMIYLYDAAGERLALRASEGFAHLPSMSIPTDLGIVGAAFSTRQSCLAGSAAAFRAQLPRQAEGEWAHILRSFGLTRTPSGAIAIPLLAHQTAVGVLVLLREDGAGAFAAEARPTLEGLANLTAAAILEERSRHEAASLSTRLASLEEQQQHMAERLSLAEAGMLQAARLAAMGQLAAAIAHEINNPLYAARNALFLLEEDLPPTLREAPYVAMAREQLGRIARIIEQMRNFYRPSRGELVPTDLNQLLEETLELAGLNIRHAAIRIIFNPGKDLPLLHSNSEQLRQVFLNVILNAIEAMPDGGTLTVRTESGPSFVGVEVQDTGTGVPEELRARIFEPFFTSKPHGTGLGLAISAHIVTQHGGRIEMESSEGRGSVFRIVLPYRQVG